MRPLLIPLITFAVGLGAGVAGALFFSRPAPDSLPAGTVDLRVTDGGVYRVRKVVDGDSVILENGLHVRYHGVDTPELGRFVKDPDPLADVAAARNIALVEGKRVRLHLARTPMDVHGRLIAIPEVLAEDADSSAKGVDAVHVLLEEGLGRAMGMDMTSDEYRAVKEIQEQAKSKKVGLWGLEQKVAATGKPYCATGDSDVYHLAICSSARKISAAMRHEYATADEAETAGKRPCKRCVPK